MTPGEREVSEAVADLTRLVRKNEASPNVIHQAIARKLRTILASHTALTAEHWRGVVTEYKANQFYAADLSRALQINGLRSLLRRLHVWFLDAASEHYRGTGLCIDVDAALSQPAVQEGGA